MTQKERRRAPRFSVNQLIKIEMIRETFVQARGINISQTGVYCELEERVEIPTRVYLLIILNEGTKDETSIECDGEVVRESEDKGKFYAAIQFTSIIPADHEKFKKFMDSLV